MKRTFALLAVVGAFLAVGFMATPSFAVGSVNGTITDAAGNPVAGAQVMVQGLQMRRGHMPFMGHTQTGEDGTYNVANVPAGRYLVAAMARQVGAARAQAEVVDDQATVVNIQLAGNGNGGGNGGGGGGRGGEDQVVVSTMNVTVVDSDGVAVAGARVALAPVRIGNMRHHRMPRLVGQTDANGQISFADVPVGIWMVMAAHRPEGAARARAEVVADQATDVNLALSRHR